MRFLLFNWDNLNREIPNIDEISDEEFEKIVEECKGHIFETPEAFESAFNHDDFSSFSHQLRIIKTNKNEQA